MNDHLLKTAIPNNTLIEKEPSTPDIFLLDESKTNSPDKDTFNSPVALSRTSNIDDYEVKSNAATPDFQDKSENRKVGTTPKQLVRLDKNVSSPDIDTSNSPVAKSSNIDDYREKSNAATPDSDNKSENDKHDKMLTGFDSRRLFNRLAEHFNSRSGRQFLVP